MCVQDDMCTLEAKVSDAEERLLVLEAFVADQQRGKATFDGLQESRAIMKVFEDLSAEGLERWCQREAGAMELFHHVLSLIDRFSPTMKYCCVHKEACRVGTQAVSEEDIEADDSNVGMAIPFAKEPFSAVESNGVATPEEASAKTPCGIAENDVATEETSSEWSDELEVNPVTDGADAVAREAHVGGAKEAWIFDSDDDDLDDEESAALSRVLGACGLTLGALTVAHFALRLLRPAWAHLSL